MKRILGASVVGLLVAISGCAQRREYRPDVSLVQVVGVTQARRELSEILLRSREPRIERSEVYTEYFRFWPVGHPQGRAVFLQDVLDVELDTAHRATILGAANRPIESLVLAGPADAERFADLVLSFREAFLRGEMIQRVAD